MQKLRELAPLIALLRRRRLSVVVEIGTALGGTFYAWCRIAEPDALLVSIDLPGGPYGGGYPPEALPTLRSYGAPGQQLHFLRADSHDEATVAELRGLLQGRAIDFLLIDGDHSYEGVKRDFELYAPLVGEECPVAFHDILPHPREQRCEVDRFWNEIKHAYTHAELIDPGAPYGGVASSGSEGRHAPASQPVAADLGEPHLRRRGRDDDARDVTGRAARRTRRPHLRLPARTP
jgi:hypothetical protein